MASGSETHSNEPSRQDDAHEERMREILHVAPRLTSKESKCSPWRILAPMVRAGTLPLRLLCLGMGATAVFTEEIICHKMLASKRLPKDDNTGLVSYVLRNNPKKIVFQTCELEKNHVVYQIGTADPDRAVKVAKMLTEHNDIAGFDLNCGCPKHFSVAGGMGAALLQTPDVLESIVSKLRKEIKTVPITCKIRLLSEDDKTVHLVERIEKAGAQAITVHCRETPDRPTVPAKWDRLKPLVHSANVPIIANGDIYTKKNVDDFLSLSGASGVMLARGALGNPSLFLPDEDNELEIPLIDLLRDYLRIAMLVGNHVENTKYTLTQMIRYSKMIRSEQIHYQSVILKSKSSMETLCGAFGLTKEECTLNGPISWEQLKLSHPANKSSPSFDSGWVQLIVGGDPSKKRTHKIVDENDMINAKKQAIG